MDCLNWEILQLFQDHAEIHHDFLQEPPSARVRNNHELWLDPQRPHQVPFKVPLKRWVTKGFKHTVSRANGPAKIIIQCLGFRPALGIVPPRQAGQKPQQTQISIRIKASCTCRPLLCCNHLRVQTSQLLALHVGQRRYLHFDERTITAGAHHFKNISLSSRGFGEKI